MNNNWIVKAKKSSDFPPFYDSKKNLIWDGVAIEIILCSVNPTKDYAKTFAKQVKKNDLDNLWRIWITDGSVEETIELSEDEIYQTRKNNKPVSKTYEQTN
jgi:hypothetical protein